MKVLVTREFPEIGLNLLRESGYELTIWNDDAGYTQDEFSRIAADYEAIMCTGKEKIDRPFLEANPQLKVVSLYSAGFDNVDVPAATEFGLPIGHAPQSMNRATSDISFGLMIATARNFFQMHKRLIKGQVGGFKPTADLGQELYGKTLGIFGLGAIGYEMAIKCKMAYGMKIIYVSRSKKEKAEKELGAVRVDFDRLLSESDVISVHSDLNESTFKVFNAEAFGKMKPTSIFINTSRGKVHDEEALAEALQSGKIWGAGLDVTDPEPMHADNPLLDAENVCVLPHIGSATVEARDEMSRLAAENIVRFFNSGEMTYCVNPSVLKKP
ncbi:D-glycerate dehydrogenase [Marinilongibacter aquaticus]|uniref:2-hydroxyacid dehydrogenase n=1 Tax=Marinilongibacter aquaticus TaxID=2975157 RepID=UPI0021BD596F|nr:D-glycerate dehydrogenase [Marinilongibacter aquaticus]UBM58139.1 D-glycerate dehydrogenase [Marinilongibacter aquaticus]